MISEHIDLDTGLVGLSKNYAGRDCDNHLLFTATAHAVFGTFTVSQYLSIIGQCRLQSGAFSRYPGDPEPTSWDDHLGLAVSNPGLANEILFFGTFKDWTWGTKWLGRLPLFVATVQAAAGVKLGLWSQIKAASCFIQNLWEPQGETSGICLLYLAQRPLFGQGMLLNAVILLWRAVLLRRYPGGIQEVYGIYFKPEHAFTKLAKADFDV